MSLISFLAAVLILTVDAQVTTSNSSQNCVLPKTYGVYTQCCGSQVFDNRSNVCCNGVLSPNCGSPSSCCDKVPYNNNLFVCCNSGYLIKYKRYGDYTSCCGTTVYDSRNQSCCGSNIYDPQKQVSSLILSDKIVCPEFSL